MERQRKQFYRSPPGRFRWQHCYFVEWNIPGRVRHHTSNSQTQALLWSGNASGVVNLHPHAYTSSVANGVWSNGTAVGTGTVVKSGKAITSTDHAVVWFGSAKNVVDLNPAGYANSRGLSLNAANQVGWANNSHYHVIVWSGTAASAIDLNAFLHAGFTDAMAVEIDSAGNILANAAANDGVWLSCC